jgi:hypothetical protein
MRRKAHSRVVANYAWVVLFALVTYYHSSFQASIATDETTKEVVQKGQSVTKSADDRVSGKVSGINTLDSSDIATASATAITNISNTKSKEFTPYGEPRDDELLPENLGWPTRVPCGSQKCFYHLKSNRQVGYLVAPEMKSDRLKSLEAGWELAKQLETDYNIQHFLLAPPTKLKVSNQLATRLNRNLFIEKSRKILGQRKAKKRFPKGSKVLTQKVKMAPKRHLIIGCVDSKVRAFKKDLPNFISYVKYKESFAQNFNESFAAAKKVLDVEPCLVKDFQVLVDTKGRTFHLDFDRCFRSSGR